MKIKLPSEIYTESAVIDMAGKFSGYLEVAMSGRDNFEIEITVLPGNTLHQVEIINTFMNNILELSILERFNHEH